MNTPATVAVPSSITVEELKTSGAWGMSASIDLRDCNPEQLTNPDLIKQFILELVASIGMKAHGKPRVEQFGDGDLQGYSALQFIETSSITFHGDDKTGNRAFIDIFSCKFFDPGAAETFCLDRLGGTLTSNTVLLRR